jgi:SOS response regulatory protein OraA/RecX
MTKNKHITNQAISWAAISLLSKSENPNEIGMYEYNNDWRLFETSGKYFLVKVAEELDKSQCANFSFSAGEEKRYPTQEIQNIFDSFVDGSDVAAELENTTIVLVIKKENKIIPFNAKDFKENISGFYENIQGKIIYKDNSITIAPKSIKLKEELNKEEEVNDDLSRKSEEYKKPVNPKEYAKSRHSQLLEREFNKFLCYDDMSPKQDNTDGFNELRKEIIGVSFSSKNKSKRYDELKQNSPQDFKEIKTKFTKLFTKNIDVDDIEQILDENCKCAYCGMTKKELKSRLPEESDIATDKSFFKTKRFWGGRGWSMELDRITDKNYSKDNVVCACYWCNNAKSDEFSFEEWQEVGKIIGKIWKKRDKKFKQK